VSQIAEKLNVHFVIKNLKSDNKKMTDNIEEKNKIEDNKKELSPEDLKKKLEECQKQKEEYLQGWQRVRADLMNYKKTEMERVGEILKYANEEFILKFLPILDNFELAEKELSAEAKNSANFKGMLLIKKQIQDFLKNQGLEEIKSIAEKFDPNLHEVVEEIRMEDKEPGIIMEEIQKGYKINGRLLKPAKVKVSK